jgi:hypothetical protein
MTFRKFGILVFSILALALHPLGTAKAALLAYEGFNYTPGDSLTNSSAVGSGGSFGWGGRWTGANVPLTTNMAASLTYVDQAGNSLNTNGGSVIVGAPGGTTVNAQPSRSFNFGGLNGAGTGYLGLTNSPGTYWASFILQWIGPVTAGSPTNQYVRKGDLVFRAGALTDATSTGTALYSVGSPNAGNRLGTPVDTWATWTGSDAGGGTQNTGLAASAAPLNSLTFVLVRIDLDGVGGFDTVYTWFNWTNLNIEPPISAAATTNTSVNEDGLNNIRLDANGGNASGTNTVLVFDEFRFGTTFEDVTPHSTNSTPAPVITSQPASTNVTVGDSATFTVTSTGTNLLYTWYFNTNTLLLNQTNVSLTLTNVQTNDAGGYSVVVANAGGSTTSLVATLTVLQPAAAAITAQPQDWTNAMGYAATFSVSAIGTAPLHYQWYFNTNTPLANQTNALLSFTITQTNQAGAYSVIVTNRFGSATSSVARLSVIPITLDPLPAFPGANGAAKFATGGRGGIVYHVTKLDRNFNDAAPGTLRYGLTDGNFPAGVPRTIIFDVAGVFWLGLYGAESNYDNGWNAGQSRYNLSGNTTMAGQSAPGPVIIMGGVTKASSANTIIRNVLFAPGYGMQGFHEPPNPPTPGDFPDAYAYDALDVSGQNIMMDHLTTIYATDESISCNELANNLSIQYCNISQGQNYPQLDAESQTTSYAGHALAHLLQAGSNAKVSVLNNLYAHERGRLPRVGSEVGTGALNDFRNNVFYNWLGTAGSGATGQPSFNNFINNFYLAGPGGETPIGGANSNIVTVTGGTGIFGGADAAATRAFVSGNIKDTNKDGDPFDTSSADADYSTITAQSAAYDVSIGVTLSAQNSFTNVLRYVGSRWWERPYIFTAGNTNAIVTNDVASYIDERLIFETFTGTGKIMAWADDPFNNDPTEGIEWRSLLALRADTNTYAAPFNRPPNWDTDGDGMPDYWEIEHGLDPNVPNSNGDFDNDGYTDLEEYLNEIAAWPAPGDIIFTGATNNRYAQIFNWKVNGVAIPISGLGTVTTSSPWQPSRYDTAIISNSTAIVDAVGQHAGVLRLTSSATLNITGGWLKLADSLSVASNCLAVVKPSARLEVATNLLNAGTLRLSGNAVLSVGGVLTNTGVLDIMAWTGTLPAGSVNLGTVLDRTLVQISSATLNTSNYNLTIQGYAAHNYQLQYRDDLVSGSWTNQGTAIAGTNAPIHFIDSTSAGAQRRFYRVAVD